MKNIALLTVLIRLMMVLDSGLLFWGHPVVLVHLLNFCLTFDLVAENRY